MTIRIIDVPAIKNLVDKVALLSSSCMEGNSACKVAARQELKGRYTWEPKPIHFR